MRSLCRISFARNSAMQGLSLLTATFLVVFATAADPPGGFYTTRYDHIDVENILNQKRLVYYYAECMLDRGPCTPQGIEFKRILPEALRTNCLRCTEKQRFVTLKSIRRLKKEYPDVWERLSEIWDPTGEFFQKLEESFNKHFNRTSAIPEASNSVETNIVPIISRINTVANKPISFDTTTTTTTTTIPPSTVKSPNLQTSTTGFSSTTSHITTTTRPTTTSRTTTTSHTTTSKLFTQRTTTRKFVDPTTKRKHSTIKRIKYNYDFAATPIPTIRPLQPITGINVVLRGVNSIIAPITDIAGRVIVAGTDIAGMVLNVLGVKRT